MSNGNISEPKVQAPSMEKLARHIHSFFLDSIEYLVAALVAIATMDIDLSSIHKAVVSSLDKAREELVGEYSVAVLEAATLDLLIKGIEYRSQSIDIRSYIGKARERAVFKVDPKHRYVFEIALKSYASVYKPKEPITVSGFLASITRVNQTYTNSVTNALCNYVARGRFTIEDARSITIEDQFTVLLEKSIEKAIEKEVKKVWNKFK